MSAEPKRTLVKLRQFIAGAVVSTVALTSMTGVADAKPKKPKAGAACKVNREVAEIKSGRLVCMANVKGKLVWHVSNLPFANAAANAAAGAAYPADVANLTTTGLDAVDAKAEWAILSDLVAYYLPKRLSGFESRYLTDPTAATLEASDVGFVDVMEINNPSPAASVELITALAQRRGGEVVYFGDGNVPGFVLDTDTPDYQAIYMSYGSHLVRMIIRVDRSNEVVNAFFTVAGLPLLVTEAPAA
jgi:hypothetical protein